jgi:hypothetical protein
MATQNDERRVMLWPVLLSVLLLVAALVVGVALHRSASKEAAVPPAAAASAAEVSAPVNEDVPDGASVGEQDGAVRFCFADASAAMPPDALEALGNVVKGVATGKKAVIHGFHGGQAQEQGADLTGQRMSAVHATLTALGIGDDKIERQTSAAASPAQARCVRVRLN